MSTVLGVIRELYGVKYLYNFMNTNCTRSNKSQVRKTTKYLVNKYLYISCKIYSTSQYTLMLSIYHSLYVVFSHQYLQHRLC